jgi:hypothetical protein
MAKKKVYEGARKRLDRKLANPKDHDDPLWVKRMMKYVDAQLAKKERAMEHKESQRKGNRKRRTTEK